MNTMPTVRDLTLTDTFVYRKQSYNVVAIVNHSDSGQLKEVWAYRVDGKGNEFGKIAVLKPTTKLTAIA